MLNEHFVANYKKVTLLNDLIHILNQRYQNKIYHSV